VALVIVAIVAAGVGAATYWKVASVALATSQVKEENSRLVQEAQKVWEIERLMADMLEMDYKIRTRLGIEFPEDWPGYNYQLGPEEDEIAVPDGQEAAQQEVDDPGEQASPAEATILFAWPVSRGFPTSAFGEGDAGAPHTGMDIAAQYNAPVRAAADGEVVVAERDDRFGNMVEIDHGRGLVTMYGHNARVVARRGERVRKGDVIAYVGSTGRVTTGPHLHFEVRRNGTPVDPMIYLPKYY
jgi:murein DD-endopeptidase MepM/ murein hydrolase activator NlpD